MLGCLAAAARVSSFTLEPECRWFFSDISSDLRNLFLIQVVAFRAVLDRRLSMYDEALRVAPLETAAELYKSVMESHHRWCSKHVKVFSILLRIPSKLSSTGTLWMVDDLFSTGTTSSRLPSSSSASSSALASALAVLLAGLHYSSTNILCQP